MQDYNVHAYTLSGQLYCNSSTLLKYNRLNCPARSTLHVEPVAITKQTVTDMAAQEMQCLPKEAAETLKETLFVEEARRCNDFYLAYRVAKVGVVSTHAHSGSRIGHAHNRDCMIVHNPC